MENIGLTANKVVAVGRVVDDPVIANGWARFNLVTKVNVKNNDGWQEEDNIIPVITNNPRQIETISQYVANERQLYIEGYVKSWQENGTTSCAVMLTNMKLGSKTIYRPDNQQQPQQQAANAGFPFG